MSEKTPRIRPHEIVVDGPLDMKGLQAAGNLMYHPLGVNRYVHVYDQKLGQISLTDGVPIIREAPSEETGGIGWPE